MILEWLLAASEPVPAAVVLPAELDEVAPAPLSGLFDELFAK